MFYPQTIGTPKFYNEIENNLSTTAYTLIDEAPLSVANPTFTAANATPMLNYGRTSFYTTHAAGTLTPFHRSGYGAQITVQPPKNADAVGIEIEASITMSAAADLAIVPFFCKTLSVAALLAPVACVGQPALFKPLNGTPPAAAPAPPTFLTHHFKENIVVRDISSTFGSYGFGFQLYAGGTATPVTFVQAEFAVRQQSNQILIKYFNAPR